MTLWEIVTPRVGASYVRAYAWARTEARAIELFGLRNPGLPVAAVRPLMTPGVLEFCTVANDHGWPEDIIWGKTD
jgi:hypothetical protein